MSLSTSEELSVEASQSESSGVAPPAPQSVDATGLSHSFIQDLVLKTFYHYTRLSGCELATLLGLPFPTVISPFIKKLKESQKLAIAKGGSVGYDMMEFMLTEQGRISAREVLNRNDYIGVAPVPIQQYRQQVARQTILQNNASPTAVQKSFSHLVLSQEIVHQIGPAINSGKSIFLYGPPGNGKTSLATCITNSVGGSVYIPHAISVGEQVVGIYDATYHESLGVPDKQQHKQQDQRYVHCKRPIVMVGGELTLEILDLRLSETTTAYQAPIQVKANGGVLLIDDFGRQIVPPKELLNRWIVPLESGYDFLTFATGQKVQVPFDTLIVFSTNLDPKQLVDEAFLRRIRYKIEIGDPTEDQFKSIFELICKKHGVPWDESAFNYLVETYYRKANRPFRACQPRDLVEQLVDWAQFFDLKPVLSKDMIDRLAAAYFVEL